MSNNKESKIIPPDSCSTTMGCKPQPHCVNCSHALYFGEVEIVGEKVAFEFSPMFGPFIVDENGDELDTQPDSDEHPFWPEFQKWHDNKFKECEK